jgi:cobalt-zinc-cadmium efflux system outer membrane protein
MSRWWRAGSLAFCLSVVGCRAGTQATSPGQVVGARPIDAAAGAPETASVLKVTREPGEKDPVTVVASFEQATGGNAEDAFATAAELSLDALVAAVEERNPTLEGLTAAWRAAAQRCPQVVALDDPMLQTAFAPASIGSSSVDPAYAIQISQKFPWPGKREARGSAAQSEANAAYHDLEDSRLQIAEAARLAFYDFYLAQRDTELNAENLRVMNAYRETALRKYQASLVTQQDVLQADVELAELERRQIEIDRMRRVAEARINVLLRRAPQAALPRPPHELSPAGAIPPSEVLERSALEQRPDLAALQARVEAERAAVELACKQQYPDVEVFGRYDTFWQPQSQADLRGQVGVNVNLPIYRGKLTAAANEAMFRLNQRRAEYEQRRLDILYEVRSSFERTEEARLTAKLYAERLIPAAERNVAAARANYDVSKTTFLALSQAQRSLIELREKQQQAIVDLHRRLAELERITGGPIFAQAAK